MICMVLAGLCDTFDGKFARMCKRSKDAEMFGIQLDSLADTIDFVTFPVVFGLALGFNNWYHVVAYVLIAMAGVQRLCHFNVLVINKKDKGPVKCYSGLPVTSTSIIYPAIYLISYTWLYMTGKRYKVNVYFSKISPFFVRRIQGVISARALTG